MQSTLGHKMIQCVLTYKLMHYVSLEAGTEITSNLALCSDDAVDYTLYMEAK